MIADWGAFERRRFRCGGAGCPHSGHAAGPAIMARHASAVERAMRRADQQGGVMPCPGCCCRTSPSAGSAWMARRPARRCSSRARAPAWRTRPASPAGSCRAPAPGTPHLPLPHGNPLHTPLTAHAESGPQLITGRLPPVLLTRAGWLPRAGTHTMPAPIPTSRSTHAHKQPLGRSVAVPLDPPACPPCFRHARSRRSPRRPAPPPAVSYGGGYGGGYSASRP